MKALSVMQPWASMIADGTKTIETRKWSTKYRGDLLICSAKKPGVYYPPLPYPNGPLGVALCIVKLVDCRLMTLADETAACLRIYPKWAWILEDVRKITPFPVKGKLGLFEVDYNLGGLK